MKCPEKLQLSREDGEALRTRLAGDTLTADDRRVLDQVLQWYFWLLFALQEATFSLKRLRVLLFGEKPATQPTRLLRAPSRQSMALAGRAVLRRKRRCHGAPTVLRPPSTGKAALAMAAKAPRPTVAPTRGLPP